VWKHLAERADYDALGAIADSLVIPISSLQVTLNDQTT
jgi:hypothetical protein